MQADAGQNYARVTWGPAADNGSPIIGYDVYLNGGYVGRAAASDGVMSYNVGNGIAHQFSVRAVNAVGSGPAVSANSVTPYGTPDRPVTVDATSTSTFSATVTWSTANDNGAAIDYYRVTSSQGHDVTVGPGARSYTFNDLPDGTTVTFTVIAHNAAGEGPGNSAQATTLDVQMPDPVSMSADSSDATVTSNSVTIRYSGSGDYCAVYMNSTEMARDNSCSGTFTIPGLQPNTTYNFVVGAYGAGMATSSMTLRTQP